MTTSVAPTAAGREPIAIVGIGCRLPGGIDGPAELWRQLGDGVDAIGHVPTERFDADALFDPRPATPGRIMSTWGGFLDHVEEFDADFFEIAPREAERLDPQQRLLLETSCAALDDAGIPREAIRGTSTGVFAGIWLDEFEDRLFADQGWIDFYMTTGSGRYAASGRLSFFLDLLGPSLTVDTACSSSLVAVHLAVQSLRAGECDLALAGGANVILGPNITIAYSQSRMMAPDGRCKFGDAAADGYVRSDGAGMIVLKPLAAALADGDRVYAVLRGSAVTNDGRSGAFLATPGRAGQETMLRRAYADAAVDPRTVQYVEAHGTGTAAGDPVELGALGAVVGAGRAAGGECLVGSIKSNIGHTEGAAGVAGLIKCALALHHGQLPASLHVRRPNPDVPWSDLGLRVCASQQAWPATIGPRRAGVSAFGIAGTNAHVVLEAAPAAAPPARPATGAPLILPVSARSAAALRSLAGSYAALLRDAGPAAAAAICATAAVRRSHDEHRFAAVGADAGALAAGLDALVAGDPHPNAQIRTNVRAHGPRRLAFVFPGQGSQWVGMGRRLLDVEPVFRLAIERCDAAIGDAAGWSLVDQLTADRPPRDPEEIDVVQPSTFAVQVALAALLASWGVRPDVVVGHSMGEVAAAHVAGILDLADATRIICRRSALLRRISGRGAMAAVGLDRNAAARLIAGLEDRLAVAVSNAPTSTVIAGDPVALRAVIDRLEAEGTFARLVRVDVASHSPQVDELRDDLLAALDGITPSPGHTPFHSTVTGRREAGTRLGPEYWYRNLRQPVLFGDVVDQLVATDHTRFVELSSHPLLTMAVEECLATRGVAGVAVATMRRDSDDSVGASAALAALYTDGADIDWRRRFGDVVAAVDLPAYPWQRERHWLQPRPTGRRGEARTDPLLGWAVLGDGAALQVWENDLEPGAQPELYEHRIGAAPSVPAAALVAAMVRSAGGAPASLTDVRFERMVVLDDAAPTGLRVVRDERAGTVDVLAVVDGRPIVHAGATIDREVAPPTVVPLIPDTDASSTDGAAAYDDLGAAGIALGARLRSIVAVAHSPAGWVADVVPPAGVAADLTAIDAGMQLGAMAARRMWADRPLAVPVGARRLVVHATGRAAARVVAWPVAPVAADATALVDVAVFDAAGMELVRIERLALRRLDEAGQHLERSCYEIDWVLASPPVDDGVAAVAARSWTVLGAPGPVATAVAAAATGAGVRARQVDVVADAHALDELVAGLDLVDSELVVVAGIDDVADAVTTVDELEAALCAGPAVLVELFGALARAAATAHVTVVTHGAVRAGDRDGAPVVAHAASWGLARMAIEELPGLTVRMIDLDPAEVIDVAAQALVQPAVARGPAELAVRSGEVREPRLVRRAAPDRTVRLRPDASYLVTGAFGSIGADLCRWLVRAGARRLVLVGRTVLPERAAWAALDPGSAVGRRTALVRELERLGAAVHVIALDIGDDGAVRTALAGFAAEGWPSIRGVFHCAVELGGDLLGTLDAPGLLRELHAKAVGAWTLDSCLPDLDHFVLFSSIAAVLPTAGQGAYAASNAFLDALAAGRRAGGHAALSTGWGYWRGSAAAGDDELGQRRGATSTTYKAAARQLAAAHGVGAFDAAPALDVLGRLLTGDTAHVVVAPLDLAVLAGRGAGVPVMFGALVADAAADATIIPSSTFDLGTADPAARADLVGSLVRDVVAGVLKLAPSKLDDDRPFGTLGMDSLMAIELRNRLQRACSISLSATMAWNHPTVASLSRHVLARMTGDPVDDGPRTDAPAAPADGPNDGLTSSAQAVRAATEAVARRSDDDVLAELMGGGG